MAIISLFNKYHGKENTITNYCGLMLKILYQNSPLSFERCITNLIDSEKSIFVEPQFTQQDNISKNKNKKNSIADLRITQTEFELIFEIKTTDWFYQEQFDKYISNLEDSNIKSNKVIFALTTEFLENDKLNFAKNIAQSKGIILQQLTFQNLLNQLKINKVNDEYYLQFLQEFEEFLENENLLPTWESTLDVVNCASSMDEAKKGFYSCPDSKGAYNHKRTKYFAPYKNKKVESIFEIDAVLILNYNNGIVVETIKYNNSKYSQKELEDRALGLIQEFPHRIKELQRYPLQVFLLSNEEKTDFIKDSKGGLFGSKKYFDDIAKDVKNSKELADKLKGKVWSEF
jgi:hypothetical protein